MRAYPLCVGDRVRRNHDFTAFGTVLDVAGNRFDGRSVLVQWDGGPCVWEAEHSVYLFKRRCE